MRGRPTQRFMPLVACAGLILTAGIVTAVTPPATSLRDPFLIRGAPTEAVVARTLTATVQGASFADRVRVAESEWELEGNWLVVELAVAAITTEVDASIAVATLVVDGRVFQASERPPTVLVDTELRVGTDTVGALAFELPAGLRSGTGELRLSARFPTPELDDVIAVPLVLDELPTVRSIDLEEPRLGSP